MACAFKTVQICRLVSHSTKSGFLMVRPIWVTPCKSPLWQPSHPVFGLVRTLHCNLHLYDGDHWLPFLSEGTTFVLSVCLICNTQADMDQH